MGWLNSVKQKVKKCASAVKDTVVNIVKEIPTQSTLLVALGLFTAAGSALIFLPAVKVIALACLVKLGIAALTPEIGFVIAGLTGLAAGLVKSVLCGVFKKIGIGNKKGKVSVLTPEQKEEINALLQENLKCIKEEHKEAYDLINKKLDSHAAVMSAVQAEQKEQRTDLDKEKEMRQSQRISDEKTFDSRVKKVIINSSMKADVQKPVQSPQGGPAQPASEKASSHQP